MADKTKRLSQRWDILPFQIEASQAKSTGKHNMWNKINYEIKLGTTKENSCSAFRYLQWLQRNKIAKGISMFNLLFALIFTDQGHRPILKSYIHMFLVIELILYY